MPKKDLLTVEDVKRERKCKIMQVIAVRTAYYRANPHRFVKDYLGIELKPFQQIILYQMMNNNFTMYTASRGQLLVWPVAPETKQCKRAKSVKA